MREIVLDTETTGLDPWQGHRLVEVGCVEIVNRIPSGQVFHRYVNPERDVPAEAFAVHGLSAEFLKDKPPFGEIVDELMEFIGEDPLVGSTRHIVIADTDAEAVSLARRAFRAYADHFHATEVRIEGGVPHFGALPPPGGVNVDAMMEAGHVLAGYFFPRSGRMRPLAFRRDGKTIEIAPGSRVAVNDSSAYFAASSGDSYRCRGQKKPRRPSPFVLGTTCT